jgi:hypothetical protein
MASRANPPPSPRLILPPKPSPRHLAEANGWMLGMAQSQPKDYTAKTKSPQQTIGYEKQKGVGTGKRHAP